jgi:tetratricopeptide (TPR) repeat protein
MAISLIEAKNKVPKENWLTLQRATYYELKQPQQVTKVMEKLIRLYDKPQYWLQLSSMYGEIGEEDKQMAVMEAAYQAGYITKDSEILTLSQLYLFHGAPYKSAEVLENSIAQGSIFADEDNLSMLARAYLTAKEYDKATEVLIRVSDIAQSGEHDALLAQTYLNTEQWQAAIDSSTLALARFAKHKENKDKQFKDKQVKNIANMHLIVGMANFNLKKFERSLASFAKASKFISTKKTALQWGKYVEREQQHYKVQLAMLN